MANFLSRLFNEDARKLKQIQKKIKPVLDLEEEYKAKSDDELKAMTPYLREKLAAGATLDDIFVEAFATAREACRRVIGEFLPSMRSHALIGTRLQLQREHLYPLRHLDIPP